jgi:3D (Asp-Asp-Asp) domain-containing protein
MRIISMIVALPMLWITIMPHNALAAETLNTDEIKINMEAPSNMNVFDRIALGIPVFTINLSQSVLKDELVKTEDEIKREKVLARFANKIANTVYPEGKFIINASAYTAAADECGKNDGITASGLLVKESHTIACPPQFPLGTKINIEGYGDFVCEDRGGAIKGNHVDIYMETKAQAFAFGRRNLTAEVLN